MKRYAAAKSQGGSNQGQQLKQMIDEAVNIKLKCLTLILDITSAGD